MALVLCTGCFHPYHRTSYHYGWKNRRILEQYQVEPKDLILGDRAYGNKVSMKCCLEQGADFIFRMKHHASELYDENLKKIDLDKELKNLEEGEIFDRKCLVLQNRHIRQPVRIVAKKYNEEERKKEQKRVQENKKRRQKALSKGAIAFHDCMVFVTSLPDKIGAEEILKIYRLRWQVELVFKRLCDFSLNECLWGLYASVSFKKRSRQSMVAFPAQFRCRIQYMPSAHPQRSAFCKFISIFPRLLKDLQGFLQEPRFPPSFRKITRQELTPIEQNV